jgi:hypothetical protein
MKTKDLLMETEGSAEATMQAKLGPVVGALLSLQVKTMGEHTETGARALSPEEADTNMHL